MHYGKSAFAINRGDITITTKNTSKQDEIGQRVGMSLTDIEELNAIYRYDICEAFFYCCVLSNIIFYRTSLKT